MMSKAVSENGPGKYCLQFGFAAVELGFITEVQMNRALHIQSSEKPVPGKFRLLPTILFDQDWMTSQQIETVLDSIQKRARSEEQRDGG